MSLNENKKAESDSWEIKQVRCKELIQHLQKHLKLQNINVVFDTPEVVGEHFQVGGNIIFLNVIENISEKEKYEKKSEKIQQHYKTKSPTIHFPDLNVEELIEVFQCTATDIYKTTCNVIDSVEMIIELPIEIKFVYFLFLHEVGHWNQLMDMDRCVKRFIETDMDEEKRIHDAQNFIIEKAIGRNKVKLLGKENIQLTNDELQELDRLEVEYRNIPKEFEADEYAKETLAKINIKEIM